MRYVTTARVLYLVLVFISLCVSGQALALQNCSSVSNGQGENCTAGISSGLMDVVYASQEMNQWCWAAAVEMIFSYYGYKVGQERIVRETFGSTLNMPAHGIQLTNALNRVWTDDSGKKFLVSAEPYDVMAGQVTLNNDDLVNELINERPVLYGFIGHAVVLTAISYFDSSYQLFPNVYGAVVRDPWPGVGKRYLRVNELRPIYVAFIDISEVD